MSELSPGGDRTVHTLKQLATERHAVLAEELNVLVVQAQAKQREILVLNDVLRAIGEGPEGAPSVAEAPEFITGGESFLVESSERFGKSSQRWAQRFLVEASDEIEDDDRGQFQVKVTAPEGFQFSDVQAAEGFDVGREAAFVLPYSFDGVRVDVDATDTAPDQQGEGEAEAQDEARLLAQLEKDMAKVFEEYRPDEPPLEAQPVSELASSRARPKPRLAKQLARDGMNWVWSEEEDQFLRDASRAGMSQPDMAANLGRTVGAVNQHIGTVVNPAARKAAKRGRGR